jgi:diguanylate cyclase (GGDEF)-like protein
LSLFGLTAGFDGTLETVLLKIHEDDRDRMQQKLEQALSEDRIVQYDFRLPDPTGEERILQMSCERTGDRNGQNIKLVGTLQDITDRRRSELLLIQQANYDALTGIPNRNLFSERLEQAVRVSRRDRRRFAVIFIDLDKFKEVNDTQGHDAGDLLLKEIALRFKQCVHTEDTVARLGGDEFAIILPALDHTDPCAITAQRIIDQASMPIPISEQESVQVGASLGIAFYPDDGNTAGTLMKCADQAMYAAKQGGRNRYCFFSTNVSVHLPRPPRGRGR